MNIIFSNVTSDLISKEVLPYIVKTLEYQYIMDNQEKIESEVIDLYYKNTGIDRVIESLNRKIDESFKRDIYLNGREIYLQKPSDKDMIGDLEEFYHSISKKPRELLEAYVGISDIQLQSPIQPTLIKVKIGKTSKEVIEIPVTIRGVTIVLSNIKDLYMKTLTITGVNKTGLPSSKIQKFFLYLYKYAFKVLSWIFSKGLIKRYIYYTWKFILSHVTDLKLTKEESKVLKRVLVDKDDNGLILSLYDVEDLNVLDLNNTRQILKTLRNVGWNYFTLDDSVNNRVYVWNLNHSIYEYFTITYDMMYSTFLRKTIDDLDRIKNANKTLFSLRRPLTNLPREIKQK